MPKSFAPLPLALFAISCLVLCEAFEETLSIHRKPIKLDTLPRVLAKLARTLFIALNWTEKLRGQSQVRQESSSAGLIEVNYTLIRVFRDSLRHLVPLHQAPAPVPYRWRSNYRSQPASRVRGEEALQELLMLGDC